MQLAIKLKERGPTPRRFAKVYRAAAARAWYSDAELFHKEYRPNRFTPEHARRAKYSLRAGQTLPKGSKVFNNSYYGRKWNSDVLGGGKDRADPFVLTGRMRSDCRAATIHSTSLSGIAKYPGASPANFTRRGPEFSQLIPDEVLAIADNHEEVLSAGLKSD